MMFVEARRGPHFIPLPFASALRYAAAPLAGKSDQATIPAPDLHRPPAHNKTKDRKGIRMIIRPPQNWFVRLFNWHGSVLSMIIFRLGLNLFMSIVAIIAWPYYENLNIHLTVPRLACWVSPSLSFLVFAITPATAVTPKQECSGVR
jgi:hypothetical protein